MFLIYYCFNIHRFFYFCKCQITINVIIYKKKINLLIKSELVVKKPDWTKYLDSVAGSEVICEDASRETGGKRTGVRVTQHHDICFSFHLLRPSHVRGSTKHTTNIACIEKLQ